MLYDVLVLGLVLGCLIGHSRGKIRINATSAYFRKLRYYEDIIIMCASSSSLQFSIFQGRTMGRKLVLVKSVGHLGTSTRAPMALCVVPGVLMVKTGMAQPRGIASLTQNIQRGKSVITTSR